MPLFNFDHCVSVEVALLSAWWPYFSCQTDNGIPVRMALFAMVMGVADRVHDTARESIWYSPDSLDAD